MIKKNKLIKGFPGLLNIIRTLLDRSQTIKQIFKKCQKIEGPHGPQGLGPKTIKWFKSLKIMKIIVFLTIGKTPHRNSAAGALNESSRSLIWSFWEQIRCLEKCEKVSKVSKLGEFWVRAVHLTTRLRRVIGCLQTRWLDASKPLVLAGAMPSGGFFGKKGV